MSSNSVDRYRDVLATADLGALTTDEELRILSRSRRRHAIAYLEAADGAVTTEKLATELAALSANKRPADVTGDERRRVLIELHHNHLPRLHDHGLVEYDPGGGTVGMAVDRDGSSERDGDRTA